MDGLLGEYLRFEILNYRRIPGLGLLAMLGLLLFAGWFATRFAGFSVLKTWERLLTRIPLFRLVYTSTKQLGEAILTEKRTVFRHVVLVRWPHPDVWAIGLVTATPPKVLSEKAGEDLVSVFMPSTPNPTTGFYQLVKKDRVVPLDITVEQGIQMVVSGGVIRPPEDAGSPKQTSMALPVDSPAGHTEESSPETPGDKPASE